VRPFFVPAQRTKDLDPNNPDNDALPLVEAATSMAQQELRLKRHSAAGYVTPAASAAAAAATSTTSVLHEALQGCRSEGGAVFVLQRLLPLTPVAFLEVRSGDDWLIPLHLALLNRRLGRATMVRQMTKETGGKRENLVIRDNNKKNQYVVDSSLCYALQSRF